MHQLHDNKSHDLTRLVTIRYTNVNGNVHFKYNGTLVTQRSISHTTRVEWIYGNMYSLLTVVTANSCKCYAYQCICHLVSYIFHECRYIIHDCIDQADSAFMQHFVEAECLEHFTPIPLFSFPTCFRTSLLFTRFCLHPERECCPQPAFLFMWYTLELSNRNMHIK